MHELLNKRDGDMGAAAVAPLVILGDKLGLYQALANDGPLSSEELAEKTGTTEQQAVFADPDSPMCLTGGYYGIASMCIDEARISGKPGFRLAAIFGRRRQRLSDSIFTNHRWNMPANLRPRAG